MRRHLMICTLLLAACLLTLGQACRSDSDIVTVGAKDFDEQMVLAHLLTQLLNQHGVQTAPVRICGDTYSCHRELREGRIGLMVEYSGTGAVFLGEPGSSFEQLALRYDQMGIRWMPPLGFSNGYVVAVRASTAPSLGLSAISDMASLDKPLRLACPAEYLRRPVDGLAPLLRRHGLRLASRPRIVAAPEGRVRLLHEGAVDAAILYSTDGIIDDPRIKVLADSLGFFPDYSASVIASKSALDSHPAIEGALLKLSGTLSDAEMSQLNYRVQAESRSPGDVAASYLASLDESQASPAKGSRRDLLIAVDAKDPLDSFAAVALRAVKQVFPERTLRQVTVADSFAEVHRGKARMAVVGAERFFLTGTVPPRRDLRLEALAVVGHRTLLLVTRAAPSSDLLAGSIAAPPEGTGGATAAEAITSHYSRSIADYLPAQAAVAALREGKTDYAFLYIPTGDPALLAALAESELRLVDLGPLLPPSLRDAAPYLRPLRIPAGTMPGQTAPLDTVGAQVVLAGPGRSLPDKTAAGGPAAALRSSGRPVLFETARKLADASDIPEAPDPVLPSAWTAPPTSDSGDRHAAKAVEVLLNLLVLVFLGWLVVLVVRD